MRIVKRNPTHWYWLMRSGCMVMLSIPFRLLPRSKQRRRIIFYDQMNGNVKAFVDYLISQAPQQYELYFLAMPPQQRTYPILPTGVRRLSPLRFWDMIMVARADCIITNFGVETLVYYQWFTNLLFVNVWHGVGFRNHTPNDFRLYKGY